MKAKVIILLASLLMMVDSVSGQRANKISRDIRKIHLSQYPDAKDRINHFYKLRQKSKSLNEFIPFGKNDTIFMIEVYGIESSGFMFTTYWNNSKRTSNCSDNSGETFEDLKGDKYKTCANRMYMIKLVSEWNIDEIRKEEKINRAVTPDGVFATRIIFNGKKYKIDSFDFDDFFNLERDQFDYLE